MNKNYDKSIEILSSGSQETVVEKEVAGICEKMQITEERYGYILMAVTEAVNTALYPQNSDGGAPDKVKMSYAFTPEKLTVKVESSHAAFDKISTEDTERPEMLETNEGRTIFLMKKLSDDLEFKEQGTQALLSFNLN